jgi:hypothetical protein
LNDEFAFLLLRFRRCGNACHLVFGKTAQIVLAIDNDRGCILFLQNILFDLGLQSCQLGVDFLELLLVRIGEFRARAYEILVIALEQISRFRVESQVVAIVVKLLDTREQLRIQENLVAMRGEFRRHFLVDFLSGRICVACIEV